MMEATDVASQFIAAGTIILAMGAAVGTAGYFKSWARDRRQQQRRDDAIHGWSDEDGHFHAGLEQRAESHMADWDIHVRPPARRPRSPA